MMEIFLNRLGTGMKSIDVATIGRLMVNDEHCLILENDHDDTKVYGHSRIKKGRYEIVLRKFGSHHERYKERFSDMHIGMLELINVPNYTDILIHCGQIPKDTKGCLLTGTEKEGNSKVIGSSKAYRKMYPLIATPLENGDRVFINITD